MHVEPMHPQQGGTSQWYVTGDWLMRRGDAYVSMSVGDDEPTRARSAEGAPVRQSEVSRWFDPQRYAALRWPEEDGIRFAVAADIISRLRRPGSTIIPGPARTILAEGWSFTGSFWRTYINGGFATTRRRRTAGP